MTYRTDSCGKHMIYTVQAHQMLYICLHSLMCSTHAQQYIHYEVYVRTTHLSILCHFNPLSTARFNKLCFATIKS